MNRDILRLALPSIAANISVPLLGIADMVLVGHMESVYYIGALALSTTVFNFLYFGLNFLSMGTTGLTAQAFGAQDFTEMTRVLERALLLAFTLGGLLILLQPLLTFLIFSWVKTSPEVMYHAKAYFHIRIWAAPATLGLMTIQGWFLGSQDAKTPMILMIAANGFNIVGNIAFVYGLGMQSEGVAWGTLVAQYSGLALAALLLHRRVSLQSLGRRWSETFDLGKLRNYFAVNGNIMIRTVLLIGTLSFFTIASAWDGDLILAANSLLMQLWGLASYGMDGFANAGQSLTGRFVGGKHPQELRRCVHLLMLWGGSIGLGCAIVYGLAGEVLLGWFTDKVNVIATAVEFLPWVVAGALLNMPAFIWDGVFIGATASRAMRNAMLVCTATFFPAYWVMHPLLQNHGLWFALTLFMVARSVTLTLLAPRHVFARAR